MNRLGPHVVHSKVGLSDGRDLVKALLSLRQVAAQIFQALPGDSSLSPLVYF